MSDDERSLIRGVVYRLEDLLDRLDESVAETVKAIMYGGVEERRKADIVRKNVIIGAQQDICVIIDDLGVLINGASR